MTGGLTLLVVSVFLWTLGRRAWVTLLPMGSLLVMTTWAMLGELGSYFGQRQWLLFGFGAAIFALEVWLVLEVATALRRLRGGGPSPPAATGAPAYDRGVPRESRP